jgi:hypothetical protein
VSGDYLLSYFFGYSHAFVSFFARFGVVFA